MSNHHFHQSAGPFTILLFYYFISIRFQAEGFASRVVKPECRTTILTGRPDRLLFYYFTISFPFGSVVLWVLRVLPFEDVLCGDIFKYVCPTDRSTLAPNSARGGKLPLFCEKRMAKTRFAHKLLCFAKTSRSHETPSCHGAILHGLPLPFTQGSVQPRVFGMYVMGCLWRVHKANSQETYNSNLPSFGDS